MATGTGVNQGKTAFVEEFLSGNPGSSFATVNEAWKSTGKADSVSLSLVNKARSKLGLTGKKGTIGGTPEASAGATAQSKSSKGTKAKVAPKTEDSHSSPKGREVGTGSSKSAFVVEMLGRDPKANVKAINRAWAAAGNEGTISDSVIYKLKRDLGVKGKRSLGKSVSGGKSKPEPSKRAASPVEQTPSQAKDEPASPKTTATTTGQGIGHGQVLDEIEGEIDELMFRLKSLGEFAEVQAALRTARRLLVRSHGE